ncbi:MAG: hypothetical protein M1826_007124 [Phylliscum demangeonii]|nr:MAG: hypothetical protein M1826_007124 [Phylliscum demangeonii]
MAARPAAAADVASLPSPAASSFSASFSSTFPSSSLPPTPTPTPTAALPRPRTRPLRAGGAKETAFIQHVDRALLAISRKYAKKFSNMDDDGYDGFREVARDMERVVDVVWLSGTPSLQTPYLLSLALLLTTYLPAFPPAPASTFRLLRKLDGAFASLLLQQQQQQPPAPLRQEQEVRGRGGGGVDATQKVRIKSLVQRTRVLVVQVLEGKRRGQEDRPGADADVVHDVEAEEEHAEEDEDEEEEAWEMAIGRVYERTLVALGESVGG